MYILSHALPGDKEQENSTVTGVHRVNSSWERMHVYVHMQMYWPIENSLELQLLLVSEA